MAWLGPGSAGHFVKMVHNGIEYGVMQLLAETYDLMKRGLGLNDDELHDVYAAWNQGELNGYLVEITSHIFARVDEKTGKRLIDEILDEAKQKGTGMWTSQSAMELQVPMPTIDVAVAMRNLSVLEIQRRRAGACFCWQPGRGFDGDREKFLNQLGRALYAAMIVTYAQGMAVLTVASEKHQYQFNLETVARIWRGGCIIRAALLEDICGSVPPPARPAEPAPGWRTGAQSEGPRGRLAARRFHRGRVGPAGARAHDGSRLSRRLPQPLAARQSHPGPARLFRGPHL